MKKTHTKYFSEPVCGVIKWVADMDSALVTLPPSPPTFAITASYIKRKKSTVWMRDLRNQNDARFDPK